MKNTISSRICKKCAECCKHYPFVELSQSEINALETFTGLHSEIFTNPKGKADEGYFLQFKANGDCFFLNKIDDHYSCSVYEARSDLCKNYPSTPTQNKTCDTNMKKCSN